MVFNTLSVATAVTPSVIDTYFSHFLNRAPLRQKPTAHISYHEGLRLIRQFLDYSSKHSVEDLQGFTAQWVPAPTWVRTQDCEIAPQFLDRAAAILQAQLGPRGIERVGGKTWWQWRRPEVPLRAEWIEMKKDYNERKKAGLKCERVIMYIHGGAYYFGSVDEHRYQMQRHARKLKARVLAPRYRLAPQFPFPCGLYDCIATYLYLLEHFPPEQILFGGDSAGGGMVLGLLATLRDQGLPLPAGTILLSPWVDLTHSFPSVAGDGEGDYIPPHGFLHKPSMAWPPPPTEENRAGSAQVPPMGVTELPASPSPHAPIKKKSRSDLKQSDDAEGIKFKTAHPVPAFGKNLSIALDDRIIEIREQIQLYTHNELLSYPLVSPVMQPSLGGLPPMLIQVGSAELLRDEQIYIAHKAADPKAYPPSDAVMDEFDPRGETLNRYPPTDVQLQVWDDLCHVPHTLSFTRPAKYAYRSVAQFGAWALAHAQQRGIEIRDDDASIISSDDDTADESSTATPDAKRSKKASMTMDEHIVLGAVGKAGDPLPPFKDHMVRQRVTRHGIIYPLSVKSEMACLHLDPATIGAIKPGPVRKWLAAKKTHDQKFASEFKKVEKKKLKDKAQGYDLIAGEHPPPTALVNRRKKGIVPEQKKKGKSWGLAMWSGWGSHHDETTLDREEKFENEGRDEEVSETVEPTPANAPPSDPARAAEAASTRQKSRATSGASMLSPTRENDRSRSPYKQVVDAGQAGEPIARPETNHNLPSRSASSAAPSLLNSQTGSLADRPVSPLPDSERGIPTAAAVAPQSTLVAGSENTFLNPHTQRPHNGISAYPFKLNKTATSKNASTTTLDSQLGAGAPGGNTSFAPVELPTSVDLTPEKKKNITPGIAITTGDAPAFQINDQSNSTSPIGSAIGSPSDGSSSVPFRQGPVYNNRVSMLGSLGPDGMPNMAYQTQKPAAAQEAAPSPIESNDATNLPFKIRNPVHDPRASNIPSLSDSDSPINATSSETTAPASASPPAPVTVNKPTEPTKAVPFKLRHVVYDPKTTQLGNGSSPVSAISTENKAEAAFQARSDGGTASTTHGSSAAVIAAQQAMAQHPETAGAAHASEENAPPPPPPKDV